MRQGRRKLHIRTVTAVRPFVCPSACLPSCLSIRLSVYLSASVSLSASATPPNHYNALDVSDTHHRVPDRSTVNTHVHYRVRCFAFRYWAAAVVA